MAALIHETHKMVKNLTADFHDFYDLGMIVIHLIMESIRENHNHHDNQRSIFYIIFAYEPL